MTPHSIAYSIKLFRKTRNLTAKQLSLAIEEPDYTISRIERGVLTPDFILMIKILTELEVSFTEFIETANKPDLIKESDIIAEINTAIANLKKKKIVTQSGTIKEAATPKPKQKLTHNNNLTVEDRLRAIYGTKITKLNEDSRTLTLAGSMIDKPYSAEFTMSSCNLNGTFTCKLSYGANIRMNQQDTSGIVVSVHTTDASGKHIYTSIFDNIGDVINYIASIK